LKSIERESFLSEYKTGIPVDPVKQISKTDSKRPEPRARYADSTLFKNVNFKFEILEDRLRELAYLNPEVTITIKDERIKENKFHYTEGSENSLSILIRRKSMTRDPIFIKGRKENIQVEIISV
jgi:DNA gyrase subunit B